MATLLNRPSVRTLVIDAADETVPFESLQEPGFFAQVALDPVCGTVVWPNGADFAPEALHALVGAEAATT